MCAKVSKEMRKKRGANSYKLPEPIPAGEILKDVTDKQWIIDKSIGVGGFGEIYAAAPYSGTPPKDYPSVIKIEPHGNGPLFVEMHFYMRNAKPEQINSWKKDRKMSMLGMPPYIGAGSHTCNNTKYRFVVMDRYGPDLWKIFLENNRHFPEHTVYKIGLQIINVLEYIHDKKYVHGDIKGANLLLDLKSEDQVYLVDFGLASHYTTKEEYKLDLKKAHNGTIEYTSRDAHMGVSTMRGDFEILGYNMIQWLCGSLPWEKDLKNVSQVQQQKEKAFSDIRAFLNLCFHNAVPDAILEYMSTLQDIKFNETPDYQKFRNILIKGLKRIGHKPDGKLNAKSVTRNEETSEKSPAKQKQKVLTPNQKGLRTRKRRSPPSARNKAVIQDSSTDILVNKKRVTGKELKSQICDLDSDEEYTIKIIKIPKLIASASADNKSSSR